MDHLFLATQTTDCHEPVRLVGAHDGSWRLRHSDGSCMKGRTHTSSANVLHIYILIITYMKVHILWTYVYVEHSHAVNSQKAA